MINEDSVKVLVDDDVVELNTIEDPSIHMMTQKKEKKKKMVQKKYRPQKFGQVLMNFLEQIQMTRRYGKMQVLCS